VVVNGGDFEGSVGVVEHDVEVYEVPELATDMSRGVMSARVSIGQACDTYGSLAKCGPNCVHEDSFISAILYREKQLYLSCARNVVKSRKAASKALKWYGGMHVVALLRLCLVITLPHH
jgi:hypothetical protein